MGQSGGDHGDLEIRHMPIRRGLLPHGPRQILLAHRNTGPCGQASDVAREARYLHLKDLNLLSFNSPFKKHCVCGAKYICEPDVTCGPWLSASVLNHCTCYREDQRQKKKKKKSEHTRVFFSRGGSVWEQPVRGQGGLEKWGEGHFTFA